ncbi:hypothetical protein A1E80_RS20035 [Acinetobacter baumannii]|uniref:hypothetical protein n=1 Tax=Acinetobacter baumannii TaxID=470 RepID=UPI000B43155D|nr:hypothetical protein [Acinetobacter baumannii]EHU1749937.1 hypothetical protein [Acinetobacter baumannii]EHU1827232.1 hypothetical protein [Acinetobacter baumannii]EHU1892556.1 hypothetical protein [Acinetobacter baumannii]EHU1953901.1 hypothetical protein [Acinetobacter baumannii]OTN22194.1 hypothetical protein B9Y16_08440 [Acinetobacter baumannii]
MQLNDLKRKILEIANDQYPSVALIEIEGNKVVGLPEYEIDEFIIALKELQDANFITNAIRIGIDQMVSFGHLEITSKGRNLLNG